MAWRPQFLLLIAATFIVAVACSSASTDSASEAPAAAEPPVSIDLAEAPQVEFEASFDFLDEAAERMAATPHRFELFFPEGVIEDIDVSSPVMIGQSDGIWSRATLLGPSAEASNSAPFDEVLATAISNGAVFYMDLPGLNRAFPELAGTGPGDGWFVLRPDQVVARLGADFAPIMTPSTFVSADDFWDGLRDPISIAEGPSSSIRGVATRTIALEVQQFEFSTDLTTTVVVHVDSGGYVRSIVQELARNEFFDIGDPDITVEPPADAVDITEDWIAEIEAQQEQRALLDGTVSRVPSVLTLTGSDASSAIERAGFEPSRERVVSESAPLGEVVGQDPLAGTLAETGSVVEYQVSIGKLLSVPEVRGLDVAAARDLLVTTGFVVPNQYQTAFDDEIERDLVVGTIPEMGELALQDSEIAIVLSNGPQS